MIFLASFLRDDVENEIKFETFVKFSEWVRVWHEETCLHLSTITRPRESLFCPVSVILS